MSQAHGGKADGIAAFRAAFLLSAFGYEFLFFVMTLRVYDITGRAINVGIFAALTFLPKMLAPLYGALVDRFGARSLLTFAAGCVAILVPCLGFASGIVLLYGLWFVLSALFMLIGNARMVLMAEMAGPGGFARANSLVLAFITSARFLAPLLAGLFARGIGPRPLVIAAAALYALSGVSAALIGRVGRSEPASPKTDRGFSSYREGFVRIWRSRELKAMTVICVLWRLFLGMQASLLVVYITKGLGRSSADYGFAMAVIAIGGLAGSLAGPFVLKRARLGYIAGAGLGLHFLCFAALGAIGEYPWALAALGIGHFALYAAVVALHSKRDAVTEPSQRGRIFGANTAALTPAAVVSMVVGGALADRYGVAPVFMASGLAAVIGLGLVCAAWARHGSTRGKARAEIAA